MKNKQIRKETLRKLLTINEEFCKKQNQKIDSLEKQLEFMIKERNIMIKERNKYKDKYDDSVSLKVQLKKSKDAHSKCIIAYAKAIGILKDKKEVKPNSSHD